MKVMIILVYSKAITFNSYIERARRSSLSECWYLCCSEVALLGAGGIVYALFAKKLTPRSRVEYGVTERAAEANAEILLI